MAGRGPRGGPAGELRGAGGAPRWEEARFAAVGVGVAVAAAPVSRAGAGAAAGRLRGCTGRDGVGSLAGRRGRENVRVRFPPSASGAERWSLAGALAPLLTLVLEGEFGREEDAQGS